MAEGIREHFSKAGRALAEKELSWDKICKQWDNVISGVLIIWSENIVYQL